MLPDKTIKLSYSVLGIGATLLHNMRKGDTVSSLWERIKREETINTYEKFIKGLILLNSLGAIQIENHTLRRTNR